MFFSNFPSFGDNSVLFSQLYRVGICELRLVTPAFVKPWSMSLVKVSISLKIVCRRIDIRELKQRRRLLLRQRDKARISLVKKGTILVLHVQDGFPCISLPYSTIQQREITKF